MAERKLPPWEEVTYFNTPTVTQVSAQPRGLIVQASTQRVVLVISCNASGGGVIAIAPDASGTQAYQLVGGAPNAVWREKDDGPLCTSAWYNASTTPITFAVTEVILRQWPDEGNP